MSVSTSSISVFHRISRVGLAWLMISTALLPSLQADDEAGEAYFETHIRPLLVHHCYKCHSATSEPVESGLRLDSQSGWSVGGSRGPAIVPGDADASLLIQAVRYIDNDLQMPPNEPLPPDSISRLEHWVRIGAPDPRDDDPPRPPGLAGSSPADPVAGRDHWAFQPLLINPIPSVDDVDWPRSNIDRFVLAKLEASHLRPAPDADRRTLVRRIYYQLTGLPPLPRELQTLLVDQRPDAVERLVDRLLNSPQFGERWGRHWLDLARYADSNGLDENFLFREAWRYRNWVIDVVNADLPFDRFVLEQVAGDLLPYDNIAQRDRQRIASGFLVIGPKVLLGIDEKRQRMDIADEQIDTIGRALLGQTLGCARCHDHKFDPVPTADYYALAGILTSTQVMEQRHMLGEQRVMERLVGLGPDGDPLDAQYEKYWLDRPGQKALADRAKSALEALKKGDLNAVATIAKEHSDAVAPAAADAAQPAEQRIAAQQALVLRLEESLAKVPAIPARAMIATDVPAPADESIRLAGQFDRLGQPVPRGFLRVVHPGSIAQIPPGQSGRLQLGHWLTDVDHGGGGLVARVLVNRIWHHVVGRGIVRTVDNFGRTGEIPIHSELLDYLARRMIDSGWSIKAMVREIILSRTFAMRCMHDEASHVADPENRLLWRAHRRRLDPEELRDTMLAIAGLLDLSPMDSSVWYLGDQATGVGENVRRRTDFHCRSVYLPVIRNDLPELFDVFDFANPHATTGARPQTMVAPQGLFLLNDEMVMNAAEATARRLLAFHSAGIESSPAKESSASAAAAGSETVQSGTADGGLDIARVDQMFAWILAICPTDEERAQILKLIRKTESQLTAAGSAEPAIRAWSLACHALFAASRFQFLE